MILSLVRLVTLLSILAGIQASPIPIASAVSDIRPHEAAVNSGSESYGAGAPDFTDALKKYASLFNGHFRRMFADMTSPPRPYIPMSGAPPIDSTISGLRDFALSGSGVWGALDTAIVN